MDAMHRHYEQERAQLRDRVESLTSDFHTLQDQNMTLLQERDRYRAALGDIIANETAYNRGDALSAYIAKTALGIPT